MVEPASDVARSLEDNFESDVESLDSALQSEIDAAKTDESKWPIKYNASQYSEKVRSAMDSRATTEGYSSRVDGDYIIIERPNS